MSLEDDFSEDSDIERFVAQIERNKDRARDVTRAMRDKFPSMADILSASNETLESVPQLTPSHRVAVRLYYELGRRLLHERLHRTCLLDDQANLYAYFTARISREKTERFIVLFLDESGRLIAEEMQSRGTVNHTPVYPREVVRRAIELKAKKLLLVHNHPSGDPTPSAGDIHMTATVQKAAQLVGLDVVDHLIIGKGGHASFRDLDLL